MNAAGREVTVPAPSLPGLVTGAEAQDLARAFAAAILDEGYGRLSLPRLPTSAERQIMSTELDRVRKKYRPIQESTAERDKAAAAFGRLLAGGFSSLVNANPTELCATYVAFLYDLSFPAIELAVDDFRRKAVKNWDPAFPPTAPQVYEIAGAHQHRLYMREVHPLERTLSVKKVAVLPPPIADQRKVQARLQSLSSQLGGYEEPERAEMTKRVREQNLAGDAAMRDRDWAASGLERPSGFPISLSLAKNLAEKGHIAPLRKAKPGRKR